MRPARAGALILSALCASCAPPSAPEVEADPVPRAEAARPERTWEDVNEELQRQSRGWSPRPGAFAGQTIVLDPVAWTTEPGELSWKGGLPWRESLEVVAKIYRLRILRRPGGVLYLTPTEPHGPVATPPRGFRQEVGVELRLDQATGKFVAKRRVWDGAPRWSDVDSDR